MGHDQKWHQSKIVRVERSSRSEWSRNVCDPSTPERSPGQASALRAYAQGERICEGSVAEGKS